MRYLLLLIVICFFTSSKAQLDVSDSTLNVPMFYASYAFQFPGGDLADRFGRNSVIGGGFQWKTHKNWIYGLDFSSIFGNDVRNAEEIMYNLKTNKGNIIDKAGNFGNILLYERGFYISGRFGKVFPVLGSNPNSGIIIMVGLGYLQHKIRIEVQENTVPQLIGDYKKGYDRFTDGFGVNQFVGYMYFGNNRLLNFYGGFDLTQTWSKPGRDVNFDTRYPDPVSNRLDMLSGFRIGWIIPLFKRVPKKFYYY